MKTSSVKISVIVPIYNAAPYLTKCIDSILAQTFDNFELLLINDGSTDESGAICDIYMSRDSRVKVFHKTNGGVSSARNLGIEEATANYITFVDSDDYLESYCLSLMYNNIDENTDIILGSFYYESEEDIIRQQLPYSEIKIDRYNVNDILMDISYMTPWGKLYKKDIIDYNNIRFDVKINSGEDTLFVYTYLLYVKKIKALKECIYHYKINNEGLSKKSCSIEEREYMLNCFETLFKKYAKSVHDANLSYRYACLIYEVFVKLIKDYYSKDFKSYKSNIQSIIRIKHIQWLLQNGWKYIPGGIKRKVWDFLALHNKYNILTIYSYFYQYD